MTSKFFGTYVQDDWRISRKLTLNLGIRYDFEVPRRERFYRLNWFDFEAPSPLRGKVPAFPDLKGQMMFADSKTPSAFNGDYNNIQPRIGFAYALGRRMSVRAGYGIFYVASRHTTSGEVGSRFESGHRFNGAMTEASLSLPRSRIRILWALHPFQREAIHLLTSAWVSMHTSATRSTRSINNGTFPSSGNCQGRACLEVNYTGSKGTHLYFGSSGDTLDNRNKLDPSYWGIGRTALNAQVPNPFYGIITVPTSILASRRSLSTGCSGHIRSTPAPSEFRQHPQSRTPAITPCSSSMKRGSRKASG